MSVNIDYFDVAMLKAFRREEGRRRNDQDRAIRLQKRQEKRAAQAAKKQRRFDSWIDAIVTNIQNIILECEFQGENIDFANERAMEDFYISRGVVCWDRNRGDAPSKSERSIVRSALKQAQDDGKIFIKHEDKRLRPINVVRPEIRRSEIALEVVKKSLPSVKHPALLAA